jgi:hypothetical protein
MKATLKRGGMRYRATIATVIKASAKLETNARERRPIASLIFTEKPSRPLPRGLDIICGPA